MGSTSGGLYGGSGNPTYEEPVHKPAVVLDQEDFGFTHVDSAKTVVSTKADLIKKKIGPFLDNLAKNPDKDIHWPDRDQKITKFKKELWDIIDG